MDFVEFVRDRWPVLSFLAYQHLSLVVQALVVSTAVALLCGVLLSRSRWGSAIGNALVSLGLTVPAYALLGLLVGLVGLGVLPSMVMLVFFGVLPILRNVLVGIGDVDAGLVESARGSGMSRTAALLRVELPMAWPVIMAGVRVSALMLMGIAAIAAYALGPGLGGYIFAGLARTGGVNATNSVLAATLGILILAVLLDTALGVITRLTTPRGLHG